MAPKDKPVDLTAESSSSSKKGINSKKKNDTDSTDIIKLDDAMSDEDRDLKERLETCVQTILENVTGGVSDTGGSSSSITLKEQALQMITTELRTATASMTSVPKPLKFLRPYYSALKQYYDTHHSETNASTVTSSAAADVSPQVLQFRAKFADVMSVLAMTMGTPDGTFHTLFVVEFRSMALLLEIFLLFYI